MHLKTVISHEKTKVFKSLKNKIIFTLMILAVIASMIHFKTLESDFSEEMSSYYEAINSKSEAYYNQSKFSLDLLLKEPVLYEKEISKLSNEVEFFDKEKKFSKTLLYYYQDIENTKVRHMRVKENEYYTHIITSIDEGLIRESYPKEIKVDLNEMKKKIFLNEYLMENEDIDMPLNPYAFNGVNGVIMLLNSPFMIIIAILIVLIPMDMYFEELRKGCYKVIYSQPIKRSTYLFGKIIVTCSIVIGMLTITFLIAYIYGSILGGRGNWKLPIVTLNRLNNFSLTDNTLILISNGNYFIKGFVMVAVVTMLLSLVVLLSSMWSDNLMASCGILFLLLGMSWVLSTPIGESLSFAVVFPFKYLLVESVLNGRENTQYFIGLISSGVTITFTIFVMKAYFKRKDLLA